MKKEEFGNDRYYYDTKVYPSVTTWQKKVQPAYEVSFLNKWKTSKEVEQENLSDVIMTVKADYGTLFHTIASEFCELGSYPFSLVQEYSGQFDHIRLSKDLIALNQFIIDRDVKVIETEKILKHSLGFAGAVDLVCEMTFNKKRVYAVIDFKTSQSQRGYWSDKMQLRAYAMMAKEELGLDCMIFNWSPKKTYKGYYLTNQSKFKSDEDVIHYWGSYLRDYWSEEKQEKILNKPIYEFPEMLEFGKETEVKVHTLKTMMEEK